MKSPTEGLIHPLLVVDVGREHRIVKQGSFQLSQGTKETLETADAFRTHHQSELTTEKKRCLYEVHDHRKQASVGGLAQKTLGL